jgi:hypothetical protein
LKVPFLCHVLGFLSNIIIGSFVLIFVFAHFICNFRLVAMLSSSVHRLSKLVCFLPIQQYNSELVVMNCM